MSTLYKTRGSIQIILWIILFVALCTRLAKSDKEETGTRRRKHVTCPSPAIPKRREKRQLVHKSRIKSGHQGFCIGTVNNTFATLAISELSVHRHLKYVPVAVKLQYVNAQLN